MYAIKSLTINLLQLVTLIGIAIQIQAQPNYPRTADEAELISTDIANFMEAYDRLEVGADTLDTLNVYYFEKASAGMKEYINRHGLSPELLKQAIENNPSVYDRIPEFYQSLSQIKAPMKEAMARFHELIPNAMFAPTYLIVGADRGIAQASFHGQLVTISRLMDDPHKLIKVIIHELTHFQQAMTQGPENYIALYAAKDNMLDLCLREGGAEFITYLVVNNITQSRPLQYFEAHAAELNKRFQKDLEKQDPSYWLWASVGKSKDEHLLGYVIGFKICQSYYNNAASKEDAIKEILAMREAASFMESSSYFE